MRGLFHQALWIALSAAATVAATGVLAAKIAKELFETSGNLDKMNFAPSAFLGAFA